MSSPTLYGVFDFRHFSFVASTDSLRGLFCEFSFCGAGVGVGEWSEAEECDNALGVNTLLYVMRSAN